MLKWIDSKLLHVAQCTADWVLKHFGRTKYWLEKWSIICTWLSMLCLMGLHFTSALFVVIFIWTVAVIFHIRNIEQAEREFLTNRSIRFTIEQVASVRYYALFVCFWFLLFPAIMVLGDNPYFSYVLFAAIFFELAAMYFSACTPKPPSKSTVRKLYEKALWRLADVLGPAPTPVPISGK